MALITGDLAPAFTLPATDGRNLTLESLRGRKVVLYFYPKDDTSGCTLEAQNFQSLKGHFAAADTEIVGISPDAMKSHDKFIGKYALAVPLISDADGAISNAFGTWVEKSMYGRKYMGMERATFLVNAKGVIEQAWHKVKVPGHVETVLAAAKTLSDAA